MILPPENCQDMPELRTQIDRLDSEIVDLLKKRAGYIDRAAELKKQSSLPARIEWRVEAVVANVRAAATSAELDPDLAERIWREMIEWSIRREEAQLGEN